MKHFAVIQLEFLKQSRAWSELSIDNQKSYLSQHPKSKKRLTVKKLEKELIIHSDDVVKNFDDIEKEINDWTNSDTKAIAISALYGIKDKKENTDGFVMKDDNDKAAAIVLIQNDKDKDYIKVKDLASNASGYGRRMMNSIAEVAARDNKSVALNSMTKDAAAFYKHIGMTEDANMPGIFRWSLDDVKKIIEDNK